MQQVLKKIYKRGLHTLKKTLKKRPIHEKRPLKVSRGTIANRHESCDEDRVRKERGKKERVDMSGMGGRRGWIVARSLFAEQGSPSVCVLCVCGVCVWCACVVCVCGVRVWCACVVCVVLTCVDNVCGVHSVHVVCGVCVWYVLRWCLCTCVVYVHTVCSVRVVCVMLMCEVNV